MRLAIVFFAFLLIGCASEKKETYVQEQEIRLAQPRIITTSTIIDSSVLVTADFHLKNTKIFYTDDGTDPTEQSFFYKKPFSVRKEGIYKFKVFHQDWKSSEITSVKLYEKGHIPSKIDWQTNAHATYPDEGLLTSINQRKGALDFKNIEWIGFDSIAKATVHFKKEIFLKKLTIGYLIDTKSWIFPPSEITIYLNKKDSIHVVVAELKEKNVKRCFYSY